MAASEYDRYLRSIASGLGQRGISAYPAAPGPSTTQAGQGLNPMGSGITMPQASASSQRLASFANLAPGTTSPGAVQPPVSTVPTPLPAPAPAAEPWGPGGTWTMPATPRTFTPVPWTNEITQEQLDITKAIQDKNWGTGPEVGASNAILQRAADTGFQNAAALLHSGIGNYAGTSPDEKIAAFKQGAYAGTPNISFDPAQNAFMNTIGGGLYKAPYASMFEKLP